jgi:hypothetical protein
MNTLETLDRPIAFQRAFVRITGSINAALMLSQAVYWSRRVSLPGGWFYKMQTEWEDETGLTRRQQDGARKVLVKLGVLVEEKRGVPQKLFYRVDTERLEELRTKTPLRMHHPYNPGTKPPVRTHQTANVNAPNRQSNTETTPETTAERKTKGTAKKKAELEPALPPWIDTEAWDGFVEMRRRMGKPLTGRARSLALNNLAKFEAEGMSSTDVLNQSVMNGWQGIYRLKPDYDGGVFHGGNKGKTGHSIDAAREAIAEIEYEAERDRADAGALRSAKTIEAG